MLLHILSPSSALSRFNLPIPDFETQVDMHRAVRSIGPSYPVPQPRHYSRQVQIRSDNGTPRPQLRAEFVRELNDGQHSLYALSKHILSIWASRYSRVAQPATWEI